jgi:hypothetical protein
MVIDEIVAQKMLSLVAAETLRCAQGDSTTPCHSERSEESGRTPLFV